MLSRTYSKVLFGIMFPALLLCLARPQASAQTIYYTDFSNCTPTNWQGWTADNGVWQIGTPPLTSGPGAPYNGDTECAGTAMSSGSYPINVSSRLISPVITLPSIGAGQQITLNFVQWFNWLTFVYYDVDTANGDVQVTTNGGGSWTTVSNPAGGANSPYNLYSGGWSLGGVDLSAYAGQQVQIGFQHNGAAYAEPGWYIDDVTVAVTANPLLPLNQTIGFENFTPSNWQGWYADNGVWQIGTPPATSGPGSAYGGSGQCAGTAMSVGAYPAWTSSRLTTPPISLPSLSSGQHITMTFWQWFLWSPGLDGNPPDTGVVQVSTWTNGVWSAWTNGPTYSQTSNGWAFVGLAYSPVDLTDYAGKQIRISFQHNGGYGGYQTLVTSYPGWYIDDVTIVLPAPIITFFSPTQGGIGTSVTLTGNFFDGASVVAFNGTSAPFTFVSSTTITTSVPAGATTGPITVTTPEGTATSSQNFTILPTANPQTVSVAHNTATAITLTGIDPNGLPLNFDIATYPTNGTLSGLNSITGAVTYTPNNNFQGTDNFTFTVSDAYSTSTPATVTLNVAPGTPTANPQTVSVDLGAATPITLTGTDPDNPPLNLKFSITESPTDGSLSGLNSSTGAVTYTPNKNFQGTDSFTFTVSNGTNTSAPATVTLNVAPGTPTAIPETFSIAQNTAKTFELAGTDPDNPPLKLTFAIAAPPSNGALSGFSSSTGAVTYTPNKNFQGTDSFTFTVNNGTNTSAAAKITFNVAAGTPTANPQTVSVAHNTAVKITLSGTDPDIPPLPLTFAITTSPTHGTFSGLNSKTGAVTYTPNSGFSGTDSLMFTVTNGTNTSTPAKVTLNVAAGTPTANAQAVSIAHNTAKSITLTGSDPDSPPLALTFAIATSPAHGSLGTLNKTTGTVTYTPSANFQGTDSFTFTVNNGTNTSAAATVTLTVAPGTPTANPQSVSVAHNTAKSITLTGTDPDNPPLPLKFALASSTSHGTLSTLNATSGTVTYTPSANFQGADSFTFTVSNGVNASAPAKVTLTVAAGTPTANPQSVSVAHNTVKSITLTGSDPDNPPLKLTFAIASSPAHGSLGSLNTTSGVVTYTPSANFQGTDSFTFTVSNGTNTSAAARVTLTVAAGTPTANPQSVSVAHNTAKSIALTGTDPDNPPLPLKFAIASSPAHGSLGSLNATSGAVTYTPSANFQGTDSFTFTVNNGTNSSAAAKVTLTVAPGTPTANAQNVSVPHNTAKSITLTGSDPDNPALKLTFTIVSSPAHGTLGNLNTSSGAVTYTPTANFQGADSFSFTVSNGVNTSAAATVKLTVAPGTPTANAQTITVSLNTAIKITLTGSDPDVPELPLTFAIATGPSHGSLSALNTTTGTVTYTPDANFHGTDSFTFTVSNGTNKSAPARVTLNVDSGG